MDPIVSNGVKIVLSYIAVSVKTILSKSGNESFGMSMYVGPNEYDRLKAFDVSLQDQIAYGTSILGTINRWPIRPVFVFLLKNSQIKP